MNPAPQFDAAHSAAIRRALVETVDATPRPRSTRRTLLSVSIVAAAAIVVAGGVGFAANSVQKSKGEGPGSVAVAPTDTRKPTGPAPAPTVAAPTPSETPGHLQGAGSPSPTPIRPDDDPADPSTWIISADGVGPLTIGGDVTKQAAEQSAYAGRSTDDPAGGYRCSAWIFESDHLPTIDVVPGADGATDWILVGRSPATQQSDPGPRTEAGIRSGSSLAELKAAYPSLEVTQDVYPDHGYIQYSAAIDQGRFLTFQMDATGQEVELIRVGPTRGIAPEIC